MEWTNYLVITPKVIRRTRNLKLSLNINDTLTQT